MYDLLGGITIVEGASFVAAPSAGLHLLQMGAEVIRFDPIGGGPDYTRWPRADNGASFYWEGLNKGKKSVAINLSVPEGRELAQDLAASVGRFLTNYPVKGFLSHERLAEKRPDMITIRVMGWSDGGNALDYTVNAAVGVPGMTGPVDSDLPVNHVLPAWDLSTGLYAAFALLAADRARGLQGKGCEIRVPLGDMALSSLAALGLVGEGFIFGHDRPRYGNDLYGAFGRDFATADGERVMVTAISQKQWTGLLAALDIGDKVAQVEQSLGLSFAKDEGLRFDHRDRLNPIVADAIGKRALPDLAASFDGNGVTWAPYRSLTNALRDDPRIRDNPMSTMVDHLTGARYPTPGAAGTISHLERQAPTRAPRLGEHSEQILMETMGLGSGTVSQLIDSGIVAVG
jgi:2-methylfumaryl-CoA isomerase